MGDLTICQRCEFRQRPCAGACACTADAARRDILLLAESHACPLGRFPSRGLGDTVAKLARATGVAAAAAAVSAALSWDCGCADRQDALDRLLPYAPAGDGPAAAKTDDGEVQPPAEARSNDN